MMICYKVTVSWGQPSSTKSSASNQEACDSPGLGILHGILIYVANGISFVSAYKENRAYDRIFLLYPNPNPKPSQLNKRWHAMPFMSELWTCLAPLGTLTLVTNEEWYFKEAIQYFEEQWQFPIKETLAFSKQSHPQWQGRTHFEIKYLERGQTCFQLTLEKPAKGS